MSFCGKCGTENPDGNRFCGKCGAVIDMPVQSPKAEPVSGNTTPNGSTNSGSTSEEVCKVMASKAPLVIGLMVALVVIVAACFILLGGDSNSNDEPDLAFDIDPLNGTFELSGSSTSSDKTFVYSGKASFVFSDGKLVNKGFNTWSTPLEQSGIDLNRPIITPGGEHQRACMHVLPIGALDYHETMQYVNPFLKNLNSTGEYREVVIDGETVRGCGFKDTDGNVFFVSADGRLVSYYYCKGPISLYMDLS